MYMAGVGSSVCECNTEHSFSNSGREVLDQMSDCNLLSKDCHMHCIVGVYKMLHAMSWLCHI